MNDTIRKFGYPQTLIADYEHWVLLLRPAQATLGSLVLAHKGEVQSAADVEPSSFAELSRITGELERTLRTLFAMEKINYLMLMMVDREVHYHVIPRYSAQKEFAGCRFSDPGWPGMPLLSHANELGAQPFVELRDAIRAGWVRLEA